ncbi:late embryogenesis abundant protein At1g64065-like [Diospyros lotus]|uniref:late embryogenesis abundant protein At1g64065-like n=1 Tax=Diospyros lotus TaxID=55363 RepID=UPI00224EB67C|nr:late embryogenesis abundant protein At1g64065-like [Diospyros lotus]
MAFPPEVSNTVLLYIYRWHLDSLHSTIIISRSHITSYYCAQLIHICLSFPFCDLSDLQLHIYFLLVMEEKRKKWLLYIIAFVIFQTGVIALFSMTVMKFRTPKYRVQSASFTNFDVSNNSNPSFNLWMDTRFRVKNTNFGPYKFDNTTVVFYYNGTQVGSAVVRKSKANFRSTKKLNMAVNLVSPTSLANNQQLAKDLSLGILPLTSQSEMKGKVTIMFMFKKKKSTKMNCSMEVNIHEKTLQNVKCK